MVCRNRNEWGAWQERLIVCGRVDTSGEPKRNYEVAELRAQMVKALLDQNAEGWKTMASRYGKGVYSCGESFPVAAVGRDGVVSEENRRVEMVGVPLQEALLPAMPDPAPGAQPVRDRTQMG